jgi:hypothetical protein
MVTSRSRLALTVLAIFLITVIPAFYVLSSVGDALCFLLICLPNFYADVGDTVKVSYNYFNPLKIVGGRYGLSGAWVSASPIGITLCAGLAVSLLSSINNFSVAGKYV